MKEYKIVWTNFLGNDRVEVFDDAKSMDRRIGELRLRNRNFGFVLNDEMWICGPDIDGGKKMLINFS